MNKTCLCQERGKDGTFNHNEQSDVCFQINGDVFRMVVELLTGKPFTAKLLEPEEEFVYPCKNHVDNYRPKQELIDRGLAPFKEVSAATAN